MPTLLTSKYLLLIESKYAEFRTHLFLSSIAANDKEFINSVISKMSNKASAFASLTDSKGQGIYHYVALGNYKNYSTFYDKETFLKPGLFYNKYKYCLQHNGKSYFFKACKQGDSKIVQKLIRNFPMLLDRKDERNKDIVDYFKENNTLLNESMMQWILKIKPQWEAKLKKDVKPPPIDDGFNFPKPRTIDDDIKDWQQSSGGALGLGGHHMSYIQTRVFNTNRNDL
eukprot:533201_1